MESKKEWPAVGDEVLTASEREAIILAIDYNEAWIKYKDHLVGNDYASVAVSSLKKPPAPEDELKQLAVDIWNENNHDFGDFMDVFVNYIQKKPQQERDHD